MNNRRSYLDSLNAGRKRRPSTSLEQLSRTLDDLEDRIRRPLGPDARDTRSGSADEHNRERERRLNAYDRRAEGRGREFERLRGGQEDAAILGNLTSHIDALRDDLRNQMGSGLRREFSLLKTDIERSMAAASPSSHTAEFGRELERLSALVQDLAHRGGDRQLGMLRQEMDEVKAALGKLAKEETLQSYDRRWQQLDERWQDIADHVERSQARHEQDVSPAVERLGTRLEQMGDIVASMPTSASLRAIEEKLSVLGAALDEHARRRDDIAPEMRELIEDRLDEISRAVAASSQASRPGQFDPEPFERIEARIASLAKTVAEAAEPAAIERLAGQLGSISDRIEDLAQRVDIPEQAVDGLALQVAHIAERLDSVPSGRDIGPALEKIENRFLELSQMLEQRHEDALAKGNSLFRDLERRLNDVALTMSSADSDGATPPTLLIDAMDARFAELAERLERGSAAGADSGAMRHLEERIASLSDRIDLSAKSSVVDPDLIRSLESQVGALASQLASPHQAAAATPDLTPRLDRIEHAIAASQKDVLETARAAAEDAVRGFTGSVADREVVAGLVEDLKSLEGLARKSDERNVKTFEAIHDTLLKIVDRLGAVETVHSGQKQREMVSPARETMMGAKATPPLEPVIETLNIEKVAVEKDEHPLPATPAKRSAAAAAAEAAADAIREDMKTGSTEEPSSGRRLLLGGLSRVLPGRKKAARQPEAETQEPRAERIEPALAGDEPLDASLANKPLEPGSGTPDLNAIMKRVRDERGQTATGRDADAAKSDFIAAARRAAQAAAAEAEMMKRSPVAKARTGKLGLGGLLKNRRKPVLMGIAAVLMALAALQVGKSFTSSTAREAAVSAPAPLVAAASSVPEHDEATIVETAPEASAVRMADQPRPVTSAQSVMTEPPASPEAVSTDWLDTAETLPAATNPEQVSEPATTERAEVAETLPEPDKDALAAIPLEAGPVALREAAAEGDPKAFFEIGNRYTEGRGVNADPAKAAAWYEKAADAGLAPAQYRIGNLHEKAIGVERDIAKAKTWYQLAAAQGNASAMHNLAVLFAMGADGTTDNESAARWFLQAAELGVKDSQFNMGILAAKGVGVQQNLEESYKWFALVAKSGDKDAAMKRDEIANALRPDQLERARAATELWRAKDVDPEANSVEIPDSWSESADTTASIDLKQALRDIQQILNSNGYDAGPADGVMGRRTQTAIAAFQADNGMTATGQIDEPLVRALLAKR